VYVCLKNMLGSCDMSVEDRSRCAVVHATVHLLSKDIRDFHTL
jgi:hypothetical protein